LRYASCSPGDDCDYSPADLARQPFPGLGDFLLTYGNFGHGRSNAFQTQLEHRGSHGWLLNLSYTYLDQKSTGLDTGNSSLGALTYNPFSPDADYGQEAFVLQKTDLWLTGSYDLPVGRGKKFGNSFSKVVDEILGGWPDQLHMFAKSGDRIYPIVDCDNCDPALPGHIGVGSLDATGDFNAEPSYRALVTETTTRKNGDQLWDPNAFGLPTLGSDLFSNPQVAKRNL